MCLTALPYPNFTAHLTLNVLLPEKNGIQLKTVLLSDKPGSMFRVF
jgi:hypothetical protein